MKYVNSHTASKIKSLEENILSLPVAVGIIFIGIKGVPVEGGSSKSYDIIIGVSKDAYPSTVGMVVESLATKLLGKSKLKLQVVTGIPGANNVRYSEGPGQIEKK